MRQPPPVDLADPAAVAAWADTMRGRANELRALSIWATTRKAHRRLSRRFLRRKMARHIRDFHVMLDALSPPPTVPTVTDETATGEQPGEQPGEQQPESAP
jgi:hypothetical protein